MSRQILSARLGSFKSLYRSTLASASGILCVEMDFSSKCIGSLPFRVAEYPEQFRQRIEEAIHNALLERDDRVVCNRDAFWTDFGTALGDIAQTDAELLSQILQAIPHVERVHFKRRGIHEE